MKLKSYIIWAYALLLPVGGMVGYIVAGSVMSIVMSGILAAALAWSGWLLWRGNIRGYDISLGILLFTLAFFCFRFFTTYQIAPAVVGLVTLATLTLLLSKRSVN